jgi:ABC-type glycerol-3-phosphate transport system substrate-binding protein
MDAMRRIGGSAAVLAVLVLAACGGGGGGEGAGSSDNSGSGGVIGVGTAEVYDPTTNTWTLSGAMETARQYFVLDALNDGRILIDGGMPNAFGLPEFYK